MWPLRFERLGVRILVVLLVSLLTLPTPTFALLGRISPDQIETLFRRYHDRSAHQEEIDDMIHSHHTVSTGRYYVADSPETRLVINNLYVRHMGREANDEEREFWTQQLIEDASSPFGIKTIQDIEHEIAFTDEARRNGNPNAPRLTDDDIQFIFRNMLARQAGAGDLAIWRGQLRIALIWAAAYGTEARSHMRMAYAATFGFPALGKENLCCPRPNQPGEEDEWHQLLLSRQSILEVYGFIWLSPAACDINPAHCGIPPTGRCATVHVGGGWVGCDD